MAQIRQFLRYETADGEIAIEAADDEGARNAPGRTERSRNFEESLGSVKAVANSFARALAEVDVAPEAATLEFALKFTGAGAVFASLGSEAQMKFTLTWKGQKSGPAESES